MPRTKRENSGRDSDERQIQRNPEGHRDKNRSGNVLFRNSLVDIVKINFSEGGEMIEKEV